MPTATEVAKKLGIPREEVIARVDRDELPIDTRDYSSYTRNSIVKAREAFRQKHIPLQRLSWLPVSQPEGSLTS